MTSTSIIIGAAVGVALSLVLRGLSGSRDSGLPEPNRATEADLRTFLVAGRKIDAIKAYRRLHGVDLKTAKDAIDRMADERGSSGGSS